VQALTPHQLLRLGSVWYLPKKQHEHNQLMIPYSNHKPIRLSTMNSTMMLESGDYLRIHHTPRRFPSVTRYDWRDHTVSNNLSSSSVTTNNANDHKTPIVIYSSSDFWIINKPPLIPVHATIDNSHETIIQQMSEANPSIDYVVTTQRLDINTSGLLVIAKQNEFASYFARLLRQKTKTTKFYHGSDRNQHASKEVNIAKRYRCLVCLQVKNDETDSIVDAWQRLSRLTNTTIRHFLEPSDRAPKRFELEIPNLHSNEEGPLSTDGSKEWLECILQITHVSNLVPIPNKDHIRAKKLWPSSIAVMPKSTKAVCEISIQLETGRTHQIRGQLSQLGYPLVGDEQYGGAIPQTVNIRPAETSEQEEEQQEDEPQLLALQSSYVGFWDANYEQAWNQRRRKNITQGIKSDRWIEVSLDTAWWTSILVEEKDEKAGDDAITSSIDMDLVHKIKSSSSSSSLDKLPETKRDDHKELLLPPTVQLSIGRNKYVMVRVDGYMGTEESKWFVRSAKPIECGGPYHANVAEDLVEWLRAAECGHTVTVVGGGRINFQSSSSSSHQGGLHAHVYGFSYGFGKGDHQRVASLIAEAGYSVTYDNSDDLY